MKPPILIGIIFGVISVLISKTIVSNLGENANTPLIILISGLLFFCNLFAVLFTKKNNGYQLTRVEGIKACVQSGIVQGIVYTIITLMIKANMSNDMPMAQYFLYFNICIILFSLFSLIFGLILSSLLHTKQ
jgi:hypothetical protein